MNKIGLPGLTILLLLFLLIGCKDDDEAIVVIASVSLTASSEIASETGMKGVFTLKLTDRINDDLQVNYSTQGSAKNGEDYTTISGTVTIPANTLSAKIIIEAFDDTIDEDSEEVIVTLINTNNEAITVANQNMATVVIEDAPSIIDMILAETRLKMVNPEATTETVALFYNLKILSETNFIIGQQDAFNSFFNNNAGDSDIKKTTGSDPGLLGSDFMFITDDKNDESVSNWFFQQETTIKRHAVEAYNKGMVNTFVWHFREPYGGNYFSTAQMTDFQKENAFGSILPGGENHEYYKLKLAKVAQVAQSMVGDDGKLVPIIFRPFHEFDGDWFWWGAAYSTPVEFISLWQFTVRYLKNTLNVTNMLFAFSPDNTYASEAEYLSRYPGDAYVDILGIDNYGDFNDQGQSGLDNANSKLQIISKLAKARNKVAALTESCYFVTPGENSPIPGFYSNNLYETLTANDVEIGFMMFWSNSVDTYCIPTPEQPMATDFIDFVNKPASMLSVDLPNMYMVIPPNS